MESSVISIRWSSSITISVSVSLILLTYIYLVKNGRIDYVHDIYLSCEERCDNMLEEPKSGPQRFTPKVLFILLKNGQNYLWKSNSFVACFQGMCVFGNSRSHKILFECFRKVHKPFHINFIIWKNVSRELKVKWFTRTKCMSFRGT